MNIIDSLFIDLGSCRNSSPAGKRRVPGVEFTAAGLAKFSSLTDNIGKSMSFKDDATNYAVTAATTLAVAICVASVALFATIFVTLQVHLRGCAAVTNRNSSMLCTQNVIFCLDSITIHRTI